MTRVVCYWVLAGCKVSINVLVEYPKVKVWGVDVGLLWPNHYKSSVSFYNFLHCFIYCIASYCTSRFSKIVNYLFCKLQFPYRNLWAKCWKKLCIVLSIFHSSFQNKDKTIFKGIFILQVVFTRSLDTGIWWDHSPLFSAILSKALIFLK